MGGEGKVELWRVGLDGPILIPEELEGKNKFPTDFFVKPSVVRRRKGEEDGRYGFSLWAFRMTSGNPEKQGEKIIQIVPVSFTSRLGKEGNWSREKVFVLYPVKNKERMIFLNSWLFSLWEVTG